MKPNEHPGAAAPARSALSQFFLPEVSCLEDLERHLALPRDLIVGELVSGRLRGLYLRGRWLVHRDAVKGWLNVYGESR